MHCDVHDGPAKGRETISLFINSIDTKATSYIIEFELKLAPQGATPNADLDDSVFDADFLVVPCGFVADAQGGGRIIADGVFLVASGIDGGVFELVDRKGGVRDFVYPGASGKDTNLYDTFARVVLDP